MFAWNHEQQFFAKQFAAYDVRFRHREAGYCDINLSRLQSLDTSCDAVSSRNCGLTRENLRVKSPILRAMK
jgi:hypothetical protein